MIERGLLLQDSDEPQANMHEDGQPDTDTARAPGEFSASTLTKPPGADTAPETGVLLMPVTFGSESKLNKLLQTPLTINKMNYMENYKLICQGSTSITSSVVKSNQKSVIQMGPNSGASPPSATVTSAAAVQRMSPLVAVDGPGSSSSVGGKNCSKTLVIINTATMQRSQLESYLSRGSGQGDLPASGGSCDCDE